MTRGKKPTRPPRSPGVSSWRRVLHWVLGFHGQPREVARGMGIGVFVAFTPPVGLQMATALVLATAARSNRAAAVAAVWVTNPLTAIPVYAACYRAGVWILPGSEVIDIRSRLRGVVINDDGDWLHISEQFRELLGLGMNVFWPMLTGGLVIGMVCGVAAYFLTLCAIRFGRAGLHAAQATIRGADPSSEDGRG